MQLAALVLVVLVGGILASIVTTTDPLWWQLHFSQLGTFHDVSGALFNSTLKVGGALVVVYAVRVRRELRRLGARAGRRGAATVAFVCLTVIGVNLALVGCVPLNSNKDLHDKVAGMMVLGFAALLITTPILLHRLNRRLAISTALVFVFLFAGAWLFVTATINLALFEVIAFTAMFGWSGIFTWMLAQAGVATTALPDAARTAGAVGADVAAATTTAVAGAHPQPTALLPVTTPLVTASLVTAPFVTAQRDRTPSTVSHSAASQRATPGSPLTSQATPLSIAARPAETPRFAARRTTTCRPAARLRPTSLSAGRAALVGSTDARPPRRPRPLPPLHRHRPSRAPRVARGAVPGLPRRGCTASAAPAGSGTSTTPDRRSPRRPAAAR